MIVLACYHELDIARAFQAFICNLPLKCKITEFQHEKVRPQLAPHQFICFFSLFLLSLHFDFLSLSYLYTKQILIRVPNFFPNLFVVNSTNFSHLYFRIPSLMSSLLNWFRVYFGPIISYNFPQWQTKIMYYP